MEFKASIQKGEMAGPKPVIGLLGAVGAGKSSVARCFAQLGCAIIDADHINHCVLGLPDVIKAISAIWGPQMVTSADEVDRQALGRIVFADPAEMVRLTAIVHPMILSRQAELLAVYQNDVSFRGIILDVPLLMETGWHPRCTATVLVEADEAIRHQRIRKKKGWNDQQIKNVENSQISLDKKREIADYIVVNNSSVIDLTPQVEKIFIALFNKMG